MNAADWGYASDFYAQFSIGPDFPNIYVTNRPFPVMTAIDFRSFRVRVTLNKYF
jgi:hypothetical protein